jgi:hypothetical protein
MSLSEFVAVSGLMFGLTGFVLGVMNYLRDRAKIVVELQWDMKVTPGGPYDPNKLYGMVRVTNTGRRAIYISHASLRLPKGSDHPYLLLADGIPGKKLSEGDSPEIYAIKQEDLTKYAKNWRKVVAQVSDSTGKIWTSKKIPKTKVPSWGHQGSEHV